MPLSPPPESLSTFFAVDPDLARTNGWFSGAPFRHSHGGDELELHIPPDDGEFSMEWARDGRRVAAFQLKMVVAWDIETIGKHEYLRLGVDISPSEHCSVRHFLLRVYPTVEAEWAMDWGPARGAANIRT